MHNETNYDVIYKGIKQYSLNSALILRQKVNLAGVEQLKLLHATKLDIFEKMENENRPNILKAYAKVVEEIEIALQTEWNFAPNINFHEWYKVPKCKCPKMDNHDLRGTDRRVISQLCPIHGKFN
jgi:hypothetical protein